MHAEGVQPTPWPEHLNLSPLLASAASIIRLNRTALFPMRSFSCPTVCTDIERGAAHQSPARSVQNTLLRPGCQ